MGVALRAIWHTDCGASTAGTVSGPPASPLPQPLLQRALPTKASTNDDTRDWQEIMVRLWHFRRFFAAATHDAPGLTFSARPDSAQFMGFRVGKRVFRPVKRWPRHR